MAIISRYTCNGLGIFRKLMFKFNEAGMSVMDEQELCDAMDEFEYYMPVPDVCVDKNVETTSWFTEYGEKAFREALETLSFYVERCLGEEIQVERRELPDNYLYKDEYQVVLTA